MTQGLARVEELFEARIPKAEAAIADIDGTIEIEHTDDAIIVRVVAHELEEEEHYFSDKFVLAVKEGQDIKPKQILARNKEENNKTKMKGLRNTFINLGFKSFPSNMRFSITS